MLVVNVALGDFAFFCKKLLFWLWVSQMIWRPTVKFHSGLSGRKSFRVSFNRQFDCSKCPAVLASRHHLERHLRSHQNQVVLQTHFYQIKQMLKVCLTHNHSDWTLPLSLLFQVFLCEAQIPDAHSTSYFWQKIQVSDMWTGIPSSRIFIKVNFWSHHI